MLRCQGAMRRCEALNPCSKHRGTLNSTKVLRGILWLLCSIRQGNESGNQSHNALVKMASLFTKVTNTCFAAGLGAREETKSLDRE